VFPRLFTIPAFEVLGREVGPLTLHSYGALLAVAFLAGLWVASWQARRAGLDPRRVGDLGIYLLIAGLLGAKLLLLIVEWPYYSKNLGQLGTLVQSGGVFYGGLLGAIPVWWWYTRRHALDGWQVGDVVAPALAVGQSIGRLGCLAAGCCHGRPTDVGWGVTFSDPYAARAVGTPLDIALHPTQLYESAATLLIFLVLVWLAPRKRFDGQVFLTYAALYAVARFVIEFFRGDERGSVLGGLLSTSQLVSLLLVLGVVLVVPWLLKKQQRAQEEPAEA
jgi:phosphatidylglycerol:prolipoprotein diacylglycerol transferase